MPAHAGLGGNGVDAIACGDVDPVATAMWGQVTTPRDWGSEYGKPRYENPNNHSLALRVRFGQASLLITGDMEEVALQEFVERYEGTNELDADVYLAGHHGSVNGTTESLLKAVSPSVAVISMGPSGREIHWTAWKYGHPRQEVVALLERYVERTRPNITVKVGGERRNFEPKP
jgi:competence protein ComEC